MFYIHAHLRPRVKSYRLILDEDRLDREILPWGRKLTNFKYLPRNYTIEYLQPSKYTLRAKLVSPRVKSYNSTLDEDRLDREMLP